MLFFGEKIGMGENLAAGGRSAVRTPMQWSSGRNGGFSRAKPSSLAAPVVEGGFAPEHVNVDDQRKDRDSLWHFRSLLIRRYRDRPELGWGEFSVITQPHASVLAHRCTLDDGSLVALHNLGSEPRTVPLGLGEGVAGRSLVDLLDAGTTPLGEDGRAEIVLDGYGYRWLRLVTPGDRPLI